MFGTAFSWSKVLALFLTVIGVSMGCFVELYFETSEGEFKATTSGILILFMSAFSQAIQHNLEERIYRRDHDLGAVDMQVM